MVEVIAFTGESVEDEVLKFSHEHNVTKIIAGKSEIPRWQWQHVVLVHEGAKVRVYLNGALEIEGDAAACNIAQCFFAGRSDNDSNWEGRIDEVAVFDRALSEAEVAKLVVK